MPIKTCLFSTFSQILLILKVKFFSFNFEQIGLKEIGLRFMANKLQVDKARDLSVESLKKSQVAPPPMYRVMLINDDYTPMDFVIDVLQRFFNMQLEKAVSTMLEVHYLGKGTCGVFSYEIAETKVSLVNAYANGHDFPLLCVMELESEY